MSGPKLNRRDFLRTGGVGVVALGNVAWLKPVFSAQSDVLEVYIRSNYTLGLWYFDPLGLYVRPGQRVRWVATKWGATVTAFHPDNDNHELRIPERAKRFDSGTLGDDVNTTFEWTFDVDGTYDYYSRNHEVLGMVGRIVVGTPGGPGEKPPGYGAREGRKAIFSRATRVFNSAQSSEIVSRKQIPFPMEILQSRYPS